MPNGKPIQKGIYNGNYKHGGKGTKLYEVWYSMRKRCSNPKSQHYAEYGARGIRVCAEWENDFSVFRDWATSNGYVEGLTIDRIDNNGNYEPNNCRWVDRYVQCNNQRTTVHIEYNGETHTLHEWAKIIGINPTTLYHRIYKRNWSVDRAFTEIVSLNKHKRTRIPLAERSGK